MLLSRTVFSLWALVVAVLAAATFVEWRCGSDTAARTVYGSLWFAGLWAALLLAGGWLSLRCRLHRRGFVFGLHLALAVILAGAGITRFTAGRGTLHLRQGAAVQSYVDDASGEERPLPFPVKLLLFDIAYHPGTNLPADYISFLKVGDEVCRVSMNRIRREQGYRLLQASYDPDEMGSTLMVCRDPWGIGVTYAGYLLLAVSMAGVLYERLGWRGLLCTVLPVAVLGCGLGQVKPLTPVLRSPLLAVHVSVIASAYLLLALTALCSAAALLVPRWSERLDGWNGRLLCPAVFLLAAGIFIGAVWANISWGRYWGWDPKEVWALITLLLFSLPLHGASFPWLRSARVRHLWCLTAFLSVWMTWYGVNTLLGGMHAYGGV